MRVLRRWSTIRTGAPGQSLAKRRWLLERGDLAAADRLLRETKPQLATEREGATISLWPAQSGARTFRKSDRDVERDFEIAGGRFASASRRHLFALADAHLPAKTPEAGDDALEEFIDHHPNDDALPAIFAKLDELYRMERKPSTNELQHWVRDPAQPRQALAQWYFARSALRAGDREKAIALLTQLRDSPVRLPSLGEADLELARLHLAKGQWEEAIAGRGGGARGKIPRRILLQQADWLIAEANYRSRPLG